MDFDRGPGKILKYDLKRGKFRFLGPPFEVWAPVKNIASPSLSTALDLDFQCKKLHKYV
jgi:hypothetical protein